MIKLWRSWGRLGDRLIDKHSGYHQQPRRLRKGGILSLGGKRWVIHILEFFRAGEIGGNLKIINVVKHRNVFKGCAHLASHRKDHHQRNEIFAHKQQSHWRQMFLSNQPACLCLVLLFSTQRPSTPEIPSMKRALSEMQTGPIVPPRSIAPLSHKWRQSG